MAGLWTSFTLSGPGGGNSVIRMADGRLLSVGGANGAGVYHLDTHYAGAWNLSGATQAVAFSDGTILATAVRAETGETIGTFYDRSGQAIKWPFPIYPGEITVLPNNNFIVNEGGSRLWYYNAAGEVSEFSPLRSSQIGGVVGFTDGGFAYVSQSTADGRMAVGIFHPSGVLKRIVSLGFWTVGADSDIALLSDGNLVVITGNKFNIVDPNTGAVTVSGTYDISGQPLDKLDPQVVALDNGKFAIKFVYKSGSGGVTFNKGRVEEYDSSGTYLRGYETGVDAKLTALQDGMYAILEPDSGWVKVYDAHTSGINWTSSSSDFEHIQYAGTDYADTLDGGTGSDSLYAGAGNDLLYASTGGEYYNYYLGGAGNDTVSYAHVQVGANGVGVEINANDPSLSTGAAKLDYYNSIERIQGSDGNDIIRGAAGIVTLDGGKGDDWVIGSNEAHHLRGDDGADLLWAGWSNDTLYGGVGSDTLVGGAGADQLDGGYDSPQITNYVSYVSAAAPVWVFMDQSLNPDANKVNTGDAAGDTFLNIKGLIGSNGNDRLGGTADHDTLNGGAGADTLYGGAGSDTYVIDDAGDLIVDSSSSIYDMDTAVLVGSAFGGYYSVNMSPGIENVTAGAGTVFMIIEGNDGNNKLVGNDHGGALLGGKGHDTLDSGGNAYSATEQDTLDGGEGNDTYWIRSSNDLIRDIQGTNTAYVAAGLSYTLAGGVGIDYLKAENSSTGVRMVGNAWYQKIEGSHGSDTLASGGGGDWLDGGNGDDIYEVSDPSASFKLTDASGNDTLRLVNTSLASYTLGSGVAVENLEAGEGTGTITLVGNSSDNVIIGNGLANTLQGGGGNDTLRGGAGDDTYKIHFTGQQSTEVIEENLDRSVGGSADKVVLTAEGRAVTYFLHDGVEILDASALSADFSDLRGNSQANFIMGGAGKDLLSAGVGNDLFLSDQDTLSGGSNNDHYYIGINDEIREVDGGGFDRAYIYLRNDANRYVLNAGAQVEELVLVSQDPWQPDPELPDYIAVKAAIAGNEYSQRIVTGYGNDTLEGGKNLTGLPGDTLEGGWGHDTYIVHNYGDVIVEDEVSIPDGGYDIIILKTTEYELNDGVQIEEIRVNPNNANLNYVIVGNEVDQKIITGNGQDILSGGGGQDTLEGGGGNDTYQIFDGIDIINDTTEDNTVEAYTSYKLSDNARVWRFESKVNSGIRLEGNGYGNFLVSSVGIDTLLSGAGDDTYFVNNEGDVIESDSNGDDTLIVSTGKYALKAGVAIEKIQADSNNWTASYSIAGNSTDQKIVTYDGNDTLDDGGGKDTLEGGKGHDTYIIRSSETTINDVTEENTVQAYVDYKLGDNAWVRLFESKAATGIKMEGNAYANSIVGGAGNDTLDGGAGTELDTLVGGEGGDTYVIRANTDKFEETGSTGVDIVKATLDFTLAAGVGIEEIHADTRTGNAHFKLTGNELSNTIIGAEGNDTLNGTKNKAGVAGDRLVGGNGDDFYEIYNLDDVAVELENGGFDTAIVWAKDYDVSKLAHIEKIIVAMTGGGNNDVMTGTDADNIMDGGEGNDLLDGKGGNDTLRGAGGVDTLIGGADNDVLDGGTGNDSMDGGTGNDIYYIRDLGDTITESTNATGGTDKAIIFTNYFKLENTVGVEFLEVDQSNNQSVHLIGNNLANTITGGTGDDTLEAGGASNGVDSLSGGLGNDVYVISDLTTATVVETNGLTNGRDTIRLVNTAATTWTLADNFENLEAGAGTGAIELIGNDADNEIKGNASANNIRGGAGVDILDGGVGAADTLRGELDDDIYRIRNRNDVIVEVNDPLAGTNDMVEVYTGYYKLGADAAVEVLRAGINYSSEPGKGVYLVANDFATLMYGGEYADTLDGGEGATVAHTLRGGSGNDVYIIRHRGDRVLDEVANGNSTINGSNDEAYVYRSDFADDEEYENFISDLQLNYGIEVIHRNTAPPPPPDSNSAPTDILLSDNWAREWARDGFGICSLEAVDNDGAADTYTFKFVIGMDAQNNPILSDTDAEGRFIIDGGILRVLDGTKIDFEKAREHELIILVDDGHGHTFIKEQVIISVRDWLNENGTGTGASELFKGGAGDDIWDAGGGDDTLMSGYGSDDMFGGDGSDVFVYKTDLIEGEVDTIQDFTVGEDKIHLQGDLFQLDALVGGEIDDITFCIGVQATTAEHRIIYDNVQGILYYDEDGSGVAGTMQIAIFANQAQLSKSDFLII